MKYKIIIILKMTKIVIITKDIVKIIKKFRKTKKELLLF